MRAKRPYKPQHALRQFLENDRKVLRFYCVWDDTNDAYGGDLHRMVIHYFLSDDTIEIRERIVGKGGDSQAQKHSTLFLRRCKLPKRTDRIKPMNGIETPLEFYTDRDLIIG